MRFNVALIDMEMPNVDGLALAIQTRNGSGLNTSAMMILISAAEYPATGQSRPFDGFLHKPIGGHDSTSVEERMMDELGRMTG